MMQTKQTIAILGATGNTGKIVAKKLASKKYRLLLSDTVEPQINHLIQEISNLHPNSDLEAITCSFEACWESDIIITDLPENSEKEIAEKIRAVANQKTLIQLLSPNHSRRLCMMQDLLPNSNIIHVITQPSNLSGEDLSPATLISNQIKHLDDIQQLLLDAGIYAKV